MAVEQLNPAAQTTPAASGGTRYPRYDLATCVEVPRALHTKGGGQATPDQLAAHLGYKGTNNGAYLTKVASARYFGLIAKVGPVFIPTQLAHQILSPVYPHEAKKGLVDAFLNVDLFKRIYEDFKGRELPPEFGMKNALRNQYGIAASNVNDAYRSLLESAETAGFFATKAGARTHLIMPLVQPVPQAQPLAPAVEPAPEFGGGSGGDGGDGGDGFALGGAGGMPNPAHAAGKPLGLNEVKAKYLSTLIQLFETKSRDGELDEKLMERIERLLGEAKNGGQP